LFGGIGFVGSTAAASASNSIFESSSVANFEKEVMQGEKKFFI
jgi:hypothetical protein